MNQQINVREVPIEEVIKVSSAIPEFRGSDYRRYFEERYRDKEHLIIAAYLDEKPAGYIVAYDEYEDNSFYCWMAGVGLEFRRKGILKALVDYLEGWAKEKGYSKIKIKTRNRRREMLSYLIKYGFNLTGVERFPDVCDHRIYLEKEI